MNKVAISTNLREISKVEDEVETFTQDRLIVRPGVEPVAYCSGFLKIQCLSSHLQYNRKSSAQKQSSATHSK
jgi:hypothetical protein